MRTASEVLNAALNLSSEQRSEIAYQLLMSLEPEAADSDVDQAWAAEIRLRREAIREGKSTLRDWDEALAAVRRSIMSKGVA